MICDAVCQRQSISGNDANFNEYLTTVNNVSCHMTYDLFLPLLRNVMRNHSSDPKSHPRAVEARCR